MKGVMVPLALFVLFASPCLAQERDRDNEIGALLKQLELESRRDLAIAELAEMGKPAAEALRKALAEELDRGRTDIAGAMVRALGAIGAEAVDAKPDLETLARGDNQALVRLARNALVSMRAAGLTVVADYSNNEILEVDATGKVVHRLVGMFGAWDVEILPNGNYLVTEFSVSRVSEVTRNGQVVWSFTDLKNPYDADRLPDGNTLIADTFGGRVIEVDRKGKVVWSYANNIRPFDADRLMNGNTLITDVTGDRVLEVDPTGTVIWQVPRMGNCHDADRLPNGNTLITLRTVNQVVEVDPKGQEVFRIAGLNSPSDADRLANGNTLVAENGMVREFDRQGKEVGRILAKWAVEANRY